MSEWWHSTYETVITSGGRIATSHMKNRITKKNGMGSSKTKRCTCSYKNKEGTDHTKEKQAPL